jgi:hypothetical protein
VWEPWTQLSFSTGNVISTARIVISLLHAYWQCRFHTDINRSKWVTYAVKVGFFIVVMKNHGMKLYGRVEILIHAYLIFVLDGGR